MQIEVIIGTSIFSGVQIVGVALPGEINGINLCNAAEAAASGNRPATTQQIGNHTVADTITYLVSRWTAWATTYNIDLQVKVKPRKVGAF